MQQQFVSFLARCLWLTWIAFVPSAVLAENPAELGQVQWNQWERGKRLASRTGKPLFVQFQEVPG